MSIKEIKDIKIEYVINMNDIYHIRAILEELEKYLKKNNLSSIAGMELALILAFAKDQDSSQDY